MNSVTERQLEMALFENAPNDISSPTPANLSGPRPVPANVVSRIDGEISSLNEGVELDVGDGDSVGVTLFDTPSSNDESVTIVLPADQLDVVPNRAFVRISGSGSTDRKYLGQVIRGPFYEPDGLRGDAAPIITTAVRGKRMFVPRYHGRAEVEIIGEETRGGTRPHRYRPRPNSPVRLLEEVEVKSYLNASGDIQIGLAMGYDDIDVGLPSFNKSVLPRHLAVLGTTGGGKSTTVSRLIFEAQKSGMAVIVIDVESEYSHIHEPTEDDRMKTLLADRDMEASGVPRDHVKLLHLTGRETNNPQHPHLTEFSLAFDALSPDAVTEILEMNEAQQGRFLTAYDIAVDVMVSTGRLTPEARIDWDQFERGCPGLTLDMLHDVVRACAQKVDKKTLKDFKPVSSGFNGHADELRAAVDSTEGLTHKTSWWKVQGMLGQLRRFGIFDSRSGKTLYDIDLVRSGQVSLVDLSDTDSPYLRNLAIAEVLRAVQLAQEEAFERANKEHDTEIPRTLVIIEEAHEFISSQRIKQMPVLFGQIIRIARRGRKRWLGLCFVSQSPQHLPSEIFGLINNVVLHKLTDSNVIRELRRSFGSVDAGLWDRLPGLAPGQAIVSREGMARPLLVAVDPTPCKLLLIE